MAKLTAILALLASGLGLPGCATFADLRFETVTEDQLASPTRPITADYEVTRMVATDRMGLITAKYAWLMSPDDWFLRSLGDRVRAVCAESGLFRSVEAGSGDADVHLAVRLEEMNDR